MLLTLNSYKYSTDFKNGEAEFNLDIIREIEDTREKSQEYLDKYLSGKAKFDANLFEKIKSFNQLLKTISESRRLYFWILSLGITVGGVALATILAFLPISIGMSAIFGFTISTTASIIATNLRRKRYKKLVSSFESTCEQAYTKSHTLGKTFTLTNNLNQPKELASVHTSTQLNLLTMLKSSFQNPSTTIQDPPPSILTPPTPSPEENHIQTSTTTNTVGAIPTTGPATPSIPTVSTTIPNQGGTI